MGGQTEIFCVLTCEVRNGIHLLVRKEEDGGNFVGKRFSAGRGIENFHAIGRDFAELPNETWFIKTGGDDARLGLEGAGGEFVKLFGNKKLCRVGEAQCGHQQTRHGGDGKTADIKFERNEDVLLATTKYQQ